MHHTRSACYFTRRIRSNGNRPQRGSNDTSHGVRCLSAKSTKVIVSTPAYLTAAFRSQGFSPSQRFDPTLASRLCFAPHPPIGFWPSELLPPGQPLSLSALRALLPSSQPFQCFLWTTLASQHRPRSTPSRPAPTSEPLSDQPFDTRRHAVSAPAGRCSPGLLPLRGVRTRPLGLRPPLMCFHAARHTTKVARLRRCTPRSQSGRAWAPLRRVDPASMRLTTLYNPANRDAAVQARQAVHSPAPRAKLHRLPTEVRIQFY